MPRPLRTALLCTALLHSALGLAAPGAQADYPTLQPLDELLAGTGQGRLTVGGGADLLSRAERLRARAAALRAREVFDAATRARLAALQDRTGG